MVKWLRQSIHEISLYPCEHSVKLSVLVYEGLTSIIGQTLTDKYINIDAVCFSLACCSCVVCLLYGLLLLLSLARLYAFMLILVSFFNIWVLFLSLLISL